MSSVQLSDEAVSALVTKALVESMTPEKRDELIQGAIASLLESPPAGRDRYSSDKRSNLQISFDRAVSDLAYKFALEDLTNNEEFRAKVRKLWTDVASKLFEGDPNDYDSMVQVMARAIAAGMGRDR